MNGNVDPIWRGVMHHKFILVQFFCLSKSRTIPVSLTWLTPISRCLGFESRSWACVCLAAGGFYTKLLKLKYSLITNKRKCADALYFTKEWIVDFKTRISTWPKSWSCRNSLLSSRLRKRANKVRLRPQGGRVLVIEYNLGRIRYIVKISWISIWV